jgi:hypothetical protein
VAPAEPAAADKTCIALSFNGRTSDSDSLDRGSNPWGATKATLPRISLNLLEQQMAKSKAARRSSCGGSLASKSFGPQHGI